MGGGEGVERERARAQLKSMDPMLPLRANYFVKKGRSKNSVYVEDGH